MKRLLGEFPGLFEQFLEFDPAEPQESCSEQREENSQEEKKSEESRQQSVAEKNADGVSELEIQAKLNGGQDDEQVIEVLKETVKHNSLTYKQIMKCLDLYSLVT